MHNTLGNLIERWRATYPKRADGGWWALAGFRFQTLRFLSEYFAKISESRGLFQSAKGVLIEQLSDISIPHEDSVIRLVQAKRTLTQQALISAVVEAYCIGSVCSKEELEKIIFQVVCEKNAGASLAGVDGESVQAEISKVKTPLVWSVELYNAVIGRFAGELAITERSNDFADIHVLFANERIAEPQALLDQCLGIVLGAAEGGALDGRDKIPLLLFDAFFKAPRLKTAAQKGWMLIGKSEVEPLLNPTPASVSIGLRPTLDDFRKGRFRRRTALENLISDVSGWIKSERYNVEDQSIPVFWIEGRAGDGKSVVLLQLTEALLTNGTLERIIMLDSAERLPEWLRSRDSYSTDIEPEFAIIDDLYAVADEDRWLDNVVASFSLANPRAAIITCGPDYEMIRFRARGKGRFRIASFRLAAPERDELAEISEWMRSRGVSIHRTIEPSRSMLLIEYIFELTQGQEVTEFARRWRSNMERARCFQAVRHIIAVNILELPAPAGVARYGEQEAALQLLSNEHHMHFSRVGENAGGYRLTHAALAWPIYKAWLEAEPGIRSFGLRWADDLFVSLQCYHASGDIGAAQRLVLRVAQSPRIIKEEVASAMVRLYSLLRAEFRSSALYKNLLIRWLSFVVFSPSSISAFNADPLSDAKEILTECDDSSLMARIAVNLWLAAEALADRLDSAELCSLSERALLTCSVGIGIGTSIVKAATTLRRQEDRDRITSEWLNEHSDCDEAGWVLAYVLSTRRASEPQVNAAMKWVEARLSHSFSHEMLSTLLDSGERSPQVRELAFLWLEKHPDHPSRHELLRALVNAYGDDSDVLKEVDVWLSEHESRPLAVMIHTVLIRLSLPERMQAALDWANSHLEFEITADLLAMIVRKHDGEGEAVKSLEEWAHRHPNSRRLHNIVPRLLASGSGPSCVALAVRAILNPNLSSFREYLLGSLRGALKENINHAIEALQSSDLDQESKSVILDQVEEAVGGCARRARDFLDRYVDIIPENHSIRLIRATIRRASGDEKVRQKLFAWIKANSDRPNVALALSDVLADRRLAKHFVGNSAGVLTLNHGE